MTASDKQRLDLAVFNRGLAASRQRARSLIMSGKILVNRKLIDKPGVPVTAQDEIFVKQDDNPFVSRGGLKLEAALRAFAVVTADAVCLDVGASTGGFTDCLIQHGARKVFAVDVGYGQLAWKLRQDPRVVVIERANIRHLPFETVGEPVDLITIDVAFISLRIVVPAVLKFMQANTVVVALVKPQFEVGRGQVGKGGVVRDPALHQRVIEELTAFFVRTPVSVTRVIDSPILGPKGNKEFLLLLERQPVDRDASSAAPRP
ncbi:MAG: TlyA family RNA methyltransferase [Deltaproteobacteria bacterium]|nr:TlyA family RNA methyltransferase [Deltaproteobacteria bacterium]